MVGPRYAPEAKNKGYFGASQLCGGTRHATRRARSQRRPRHSNRSRIYAPGSSSVRGTGRGQPDSPHHINALYGRLCGRLCSTVAASSSCSLHTAVVAIRNYSTTAMADMIPQQRRAPRCAISPFTGLPMLGSVQRMPKSAYGLSEEERKAKYVLEIKLLPPYDSEMPTWRLKTDQELAQDQRLPANGPAHSGASQTRPKSPRARLLSSNRSEVPQKRQRTSPHHDHQLHEESRLPPRYNLRRTAARLARDLSNTDARSRGDHAGRVDKASSTMPAKPATTRKKPRAAQNSKLSTIKSSEPISKVVGSEVTKSSQLTPRRRSARSKKT
ncbi:hypothetical protein ANO11243_056010 [Dothideomycetidae sp. 11243]|nr:hypothetical protein ANO11243_056010 [fungal sp. No.11243]